jgi:hypothetical protein
MNDTFLGRLTDLVIKPGRLMDNVRERPTWWQPGLLIFVLMIGFTWLTTPIAKPEQAELMRDSRLADMLSEADLQAQYDAALDIQPTARIIESVTAGFGTWISVLLFGFILGFFARMAGGQGTFKQALGVVSWSAVLTYGLGMVLKLPLIMATESMFRVNLGLAALLGDADPGSPLFQTLMVYGDFVTWWWLVVAIIGFERVFGLARGPAVASVALPWAVLSLIPLGFSLLFM